MRVSLIFGSFNERSERKRTTAFNINILVLLASGVSVKELLYSKEICTVAR